MRSQKYWVFFRRFGGWKIPNEREWPKLRWKWEQWYSYFVFRNSPNANSTWYTFHVSPNEWFVVYNKAKQKTTETQTRKRASEASSLVILTLWPSLSVGATVEFWLRQMIWHCIVCLRRREKRYAHCWNNFCSSIYFRLVIRSDEKICIICFYSSCSKVVGWPLDSPKHFFCCCICYVSNCCVVRDTDS